MIKVKCKVISSFYDTKANDILRNPGTEFECDAKRAEELVKKNVIEIMEVANELKKEVEEMIDEQNKTEVNRSSEQVSEQVEKPKKTRGRKKTI